jgi:hypothetical protein
MWMGPMVVFSVTDAVGFGSLAYWVDMVRDIWRFVQIRWNTSNQPTAQSPRRNVQWQGRIPRPQLWQKDAPIKADVMARDFVLWVKYSRTSNDRAFTIVSFDIPAIYQGPDRL